MSDTRSPTVTTRNTIDAIDPEDNPSVDNAHEPIIRNVTTDPTAINSTETADEKPVWIRLNYKGIYHDNRRLLKHRAKNCECHICYREIYKLPPAQTHSEYVTAVQSSIHERAIKKAKKKAKKEVTVGKQRSIDMFFGHYRAHP